MLNFLRKQGNVRVDNQPNITVTNGREAYITTGDEFSYIASIKSATDAQGALATFEAINPPKWMVFPLSTITCVLNFCNAIFGVLNGLPGGGIMDMFFRGVQKSLERREIVILITPTIVGG
jgi:type II secretory pathway component GspD/PulD (secretin)